MSFFAANLSFENEARVPSETPITVSAMSTMLVASVRPKQAVGADLHMRGTAYAVRQSVMLGSQVLFEHPKTVFETWWRTRRLVERQTLSLILLHHQTDWDCYIDYGKEVVGF